MNIPEYDKDLPVVAGYESAVEEIMAGAKERTPFADESPYELDNLEAACCVALHMHQPLIPAGGGDLQTADLISNLQYMMEHQDIGDNHNAPVFHWCYKRMGELIPKLVNEGKEPRAMLEYSGTLYHGLRKMGLNDVFELLGEVTNNRGYRRCVEWLGMPWGHAVAPSTPVEDFRLHVKAWQQHFAGIFGAEALGRVRGFSPSEMALPNHPDVAYEFVRTLRDCGYQYVLVQEHSVENPENGHHPERPHLPHRLVCRNSHGKTAEIIALVKTQGSDTKLVAQMQPWFECQSLGKQDFAGRQVPPLVTQIADGENGGVMMNEFPPKFEEVSRNASHTQHPLMNGAEYLELLFQKGLHPHDLPELQPVKQKRLYERFAPGDGPDKLGKAIEDLRKEDDQFHMEGGSWTNDISWVKGYDDVLSAMEEASAAFNQQVLKKNVERDTYRFRNALFHLMSSQTSCYRYWGQGMWTDYGTEICRRTKAIISNDF